MITSVRLPINAAAFESAVDRFDHKLGDVRRRQQRLLQGDNIMSERITTVSEELHEKGMRWCDMFAEEDNRAIETYTIETVGESAQQAAEREKVRRDIDRKRMELALKYERRKSVEKSASPKSPCEEPELVPEDPVPQCAIMHRGFARGGESEHESDPAPSRMNYRGDNIPRQYRRSNITPKFERLHLQRRNPNWRPNRYHSSTNGSWRHNNNDSKDRNWDRPYYARRDHQNRRFHNRPRWYDEICHSRPNHSDRPRSSSNAEMDNFHSNRESDRPPPWHKVQSSSHNYHH